MRDGWQKKRLGDVAEVVAGQSPESMFYNSRGEGLPFYQGKKDFGERYLEAPSTWTSQVTKVARAGDILMSVRAPVGPVNLASEDVCIGRGLAAIRTSPALGRDFLFYQLLKMQPEIAGTEGAVFASINKSQIEALDVALPPLAEQQRIVGILDGALGSIATAKENAERNFHNARALFQSALEATFSGGAGWISCTLSELCEITHGYAFDGADFSSAVPEGYPIVLTPGNFTEDAALLFNAKNTKRFNGSAPAGFTFTVGDLVVVMTDLSSKMKILGKPAFVDTDNVLHNQRIGRVVALNDRIEKRLLYYFMLTDGYLRKIKASATGTMVKHTAPKRILSSVIRFPEEREAQLVAIQKLDALQTECSALAQIYEQKQAALEDLKKSLLHHAFTGQL